VRFNTLQVISETEIEEVKTHFINTTPCVYVLKFIGDKLKLLVCGYTRTRIGTRGYGYVTGPVDISRVRVGSGIPVFYP